MKGTILILSFLFNVIEACLKKLKTKGETTNDKLGVSTSGLRNVQKRWKFLSQPHQKKKLLKNGRKLITAFQSQKKTVMPAIVIRALKLNDLVERK